MSGEGYDSSQLEQEAEGSDQLQTGSREGINLKPTPQYSTSFSKALPPNGSIASQTPGHHTLKCAPVGRFSFKPTTILSITLMHPTGSLVASR